MPESRMGRVIEFTKMHGAGNDYIYVDTDKYPIDNPEELAIKWSRVHTGIGSDGDSYKPFEKGRLPYANF